MKSFFVKKIYNKWKTLSDEDRAQKISHMINKNIDSQEVRNINVLYIKNKQLFDTFNCVNILLDLDIDDNDFIFNVIMSVYPSIIPIINNTASYNKNINIFLKNYTLVYNSDIHKSSIINGEVFISGVYIPNKEQHYELNYSETFIKDLLNIIKSTLIIKDRSIELKDYVKYNIKKLDYIPNTIKPIKINTEEVIKENKIYDKTLFERTAVIRDNVEFISKIIYFKTSNSFKKLSLFDDDELCYTCSKIKNLVKYKSDIIPVIIMLVEKLYLKKTIYIDTSSEFYKKYKKKHKNDFSIYDIYKNYTIYVSSQLFDIDKTINYHTIIDKTIKTLKILNQINYIHNDKDFNNLIIFNTSNDLQKTYANTDSYENIKFDDKKNSQLTRNIKLKIYPLKDIDINYNKELYDNNEINSYKQFTFDKKVYKKTNIICNINHKDIIKLIEKISSYKDVSYIFNDIKNIGVFKHKSTNKEFQNLILESYKKEWLIYHSYQSDLNIWKLLDNYIKDRNTSDEVLNFINYMVEFSQYSDIDLNKIEKQKLRELELKEDRINIYYHMTPDEKLDMDRYNFGSEEWNTRIDALKLQIFGEKNNQELDNEYGLDFEDLDTEGYILEE